MRKTTLLILGLIISFALSAQTWKVQISRVSGKPIVKTLKLRPKTHINIGTLLLDTDSLKESRYYDGRFLRASGDSLQIDLREVRTVEDYESGIKIQTTVPRKFYQDETSVPTTIAWVALSDIDILKYQPKAREKVTSTEEFFFFISLAALIISPLACINYNEGTFNSERYAYCALGSTAGIITGMTLMFLGGNKKLQFKTDWPKKDAKVWRFN